MNQVTKVLLGSLLIGLGILLLMQLWPLDFTNPPVIAEPDWDSQHTRILAERACFDCHSNETTWPLYTRIVPIANLILKDVRDGRDVLNFSDWEESCCTEEQIDAMAATIGQGQMPLPYYLVIHPESQLSTVERGQLVNGLIETMRKNLDE